EKLHMPAHPLLADELLQRLTFLTIARDGVENFRDCLADSNKSPNHLIVALSLLQPADGQHHWPVVPIQLPPNRAVARHWHEPLRINARMQQPDALRRNLPLIEEDTSRALAVGNHQACPAQHAP